MSRREPKWKTDRRDRCKSYIRRARTLPEAQALAKSEGFSADTSVWLTAMSHLLAAARQAMEPKR